MTLRRIRICHGTLLAALFCAAGIAQAQVQVAAPSPACVAAEQLEGAAMYGLWRAQFEGLAQGATLLIEKHVEYAEGLSGGVTRDGVKARIAGDVDDGTLTLEESSDGEHIEANWTGRAVQGSCGKEIQGTWTNAKTNKTYPFVLKRVPGWQ